MNIPDIMEPDGVDRAIITTDSVFTNSTCLFVEYYDVIKAPFFAFIQAIKQSRALKKYFDFRKYLFPNLLDPAEEKRESFMVYCNRKFQNPLLDLPMSVPDVLEEVGLPRDSKPSDDVVRKIQNWMDFLLIEEIKKNELYFTEEWNLNFSYALDRIYYMKKLIKSIVVYDEYNIPFVQKEIQEKYHGKVEYRTGDFREVVKSLPIDTTYFLSDIRRVDDIKAENHLRLSSIVLAEYFRYNYKDDLSSYRSDILEWMDNETFKFNGFNNID